MALNILTALSFTAAANAEDTTSTVSARRGSAMSTLADYNAPPGEPEVLNHLRAIANLVFQDWAIWQLSWFRGSDWTGVTRQSLADNLQGGFTFDEDELQTNFFGHPYHGSLMFTSARGAGLGFWTSTPYTLAGSLSWELFAETEPASANDLLVTTLAGIMLGEITYRLSSELLDDGSSGSSRLVRELGAAAVSPMRGFNRLYTGEGWRRGPSPVRQRVHADLELGVERSRARNGAPSEAYSPSLLLATDIAYGDLAPFTPSPTFEPFEYFELYAAVNLFNRALSGAQVYSTALLYGRSLQQADERGSRGDAHVLGFAMTYDFQGSNFATYGGVGLGPVYYSVLRTGARQTLQLGVGLDAVPVLGITRTGHVDHQRAYDFGTGAALWGTVRWNLDPFGELRLNSRQYASSIVDGRGGVDYVGATRLSYEVDAIRGVGLGFAPSMVYRCRLAGATDASTFQTQAQLYLRLRL